MLSLIDTTLTTDINHSKTNCDVGGRKRGLTPPTRHAMSDFSATRGDVANVAILVNTGCFIAAMLSQHHGWIEILDPSYVSDGFCLTNERDLFKSSHALCFYSDTACVLLLYGLCAIAKGRGISEALSLLLDACELCCKICTHHDLLLHIHVFFRSH